MPKKKSAGVPKTLHSRIYDHGEVIANPFVALDSPDDRITRQNGNGETLVKHDNPDDVEKDENR